MRFVVVHHPGKAERREFIPEDWEIWETNDPIPQTYHSIATEAVNQVWDQSVVVVQDDVRFTDLPDIRGELIVYGQRTSRTPLHICPRAFAASPSVWESLYTAWDGQAQICKAWHGIVLEYGRVADVTTHGKYQ